MENNLFWVNIIVIEDIKWKAFLFLSSHIFEACLADGKIWGGFPCSKRWETLGTPNYTKGKRLENGLKFDSEKTQGGFF